MSEQKKTDNSNAKHSKKRAGALKDDSNYLNNNEEDDVPEHVKRICMETGLTPQFESREEAEYKIRLTQCHAHRGFRVSRNDNKEYLIRCAHEPCNFFLNVRSTKRKGERLHDGIIEHTCEVNDHVINDYPSPAAHSGFLAKYLRNHICNGVKSNKKLQQKVIEELGCTVSTSTMNRALNIACQTYLNSQKDGYDLLHSYAAHIRGRGGYVRLETIDSRALNSGKPSNTSATTTNVLDGTGNNPGSTTSQGSTLPQFSRIFVSLYEQLHYAPYIEYVCFDAFVLHGMYGGVLLCASSKDPNEELIILAQAIVLEESFDNWNYFFRNFEISGLGHNVKFIVSDRDDRLLSGFDTFIFNVPRSKCLRNLCDNFQKVFGPNASGLLYALATQYTWPEYNEIRDVIKSQKMGDKMIEWIDQAEPDLWCRALFRRARCDVTNSNALEIDSAVLTDSKHVPILDVLVKIEGEVLVQRYKAEQNALAMTRSVTDAIVKKVREESNGAVYCECRRTDQNAAIVTTTKHETLDQFIVDIDKMTCTCQKYQEKNFPCCHAIKFLTTILKARPESYCGNIHSVDRLRAMHALADGRTATLTTRTDLHAIGRVALDPPAREIEQGRKRAKTNVNQSPVSDSAKSKRSNACPECGQAGHNRTTCPVSIGFQAPSTIAYDI